MIPALRSELVRLRRRGFLVAWLGMTALFAILVNTIMPGVVADGGSLPPGAPGVTFPTLDALESPEGLMAGLAAASSMFGIVTLSAWAAIAGGDYAHGLIRVLVAAEPRRWRLLAGKVGALAIVTALVTTVAAGVNVMATLPAAQAAGIDVSSWTTDPLPVVATAWLNAYAAMLVWGCLGLVLAVLARSAAVAISIGVGYVLVVESVISMALDGSTDWLLGSTIQAVAAGGTESLAYGLALAVAGAYVVIGLGAAGIVFARRDITD